MDNYAVIDRDGYIVNVIVWDGYAEFQPPDGTILERIPDWSHAGIGWRYRDGEFYEEFPPVPSGPENPRNRDYD